MDLTREQASQYGIALARWRADQADVDAELYDSIDKTQLATTNRENAVHLRAIADAEEAFGLVIAQYGGASREGLEASDVLRAVRQAHRTESLDITATSDEQTPTPQELGVI